MSLADRMLAKVGKTREDFSKQSNLGKSFRAQGVVESAELKRVLALPRRRWQDITAEFADALTDEYKTQNGTMRLRAVQAAALAELHDMRGLVAPIRVGGGKTLVSFLAPTVLECDRPLLLIPAKLKNKTEREWKQMAEHWQLKPLKTQTYEQLGRASHAEWLHEYQPDFIFADEAHRISNRRAAVTRRVDRYLREYKDTVFVCASGTLTRKRLTDYWHLVLHALGPQTMPMPARWPDVNQWGEALDILPDDLQRLKPGALVQLCNDEEKIATRFGEAAELEAIRAAYNRRFVETCGVISTEDKLLSCSLSIVEKKIRTPSVLPHLQKMRVTWETPDGHPFSEAVDLWRHARELACGFFYKWDPPAPDEWMDARREWSRYVRSVLKHSRTYDSELQVARAVASGALPDGEGALRDWQNIRDTFKPNNVPVWVSDDVLCAARDWLQRQGGIVWVEHTAFGEALSDLSGVPYFGKASKLQIEDQKGKPVIASIRANAEGRNMQAWSKSLVVSCPPNGTTWEQMLGRTHRDGQEADEVTYEVMLGCEEAREGFRKAIKDAQYIQATLGQPQKLLYADIEIGE